MTIATPITDIRPPLTSVKLAIWPVLLSLAAAAYLLAPIVGEARRGVLLPEDDAYYYILIARHLARHGMSSFDGAVLTNGYHPLWLLVLVAQQLTVGGSLLITFVLEVALTAAALWMLLRTAAVKSPAVMLMFALVFMRIANGFIPSGMEEALLVFAFALTIAALGPAERGDRWAGLALGAAAAAAIGARLDAAVFVAPLLLLTPAPRRTRLEALGIVAACGVVYGLYNEAMFGMAMPVSSTIKSLGGLQVNQRLIQEFGEDVATNRWKATYPVTLAAVLGSPVLIAFTRRGTTARALTIATAIGAYAFLAKILFGSSWRIWSWYNYPALLVAAAALFALGPPLSQALERWMRLRAGAHRWQATACLVIVTLLFARTAYTATRPPWSSAMSFALINREAVRRFAPVLAGRTVAMGDRAGSFAAAYDGPVLQLEGLVRDRAWFELLKRGGDLRPALCARGVGFVAGYDVDLGDYRERRLDIWRPRLTQAKGPYIVLRRDEELGSVSDTKLYDGGELDPDNTLYLWRLTCPAAASRSA